MHTLSDLNEYLSSTVNCESDSITVSFFARYCLKVSIAEIKVKDFGDSDFLKFHAYLKEETTVKATYIRIVAMRRLMSLAYAKGYDFKSNPRYFMVPPKPAAKHFEVLGNENLKVIKDFLKVEINKIYEREALFENAIANGNFIQELGSTFKATTDYKPPLSFYKWQVSLCDVLFHLYQEYPKYPNNSTKEQLSSGGEYGRLANIDYDKMDTAFKIIYKRMGIQNLANVLPFIKDGEDLSFADCIGILYPRVFETYVFRWAICLETGWSPDMVARINIHDYLYNPIHSNSNVSFIKTMKLKGINGNNDASFNDAKLFVHPSSISDPFSAYNLIKLFNKRTSRLRTGSNYKIQVDDIFKSLKTHNESIEKFEQLMLESKDISLVKRQNYTYLIEVKASVFNKKKLFQNITRQWLLLKDWEKNITKPC